MGLASITITITLRPTESRFNRFLPKILSGRYIRFNSTYTYRPPLLSLESNLLDIFTPWVYLYNNIKAWNCRSRWTIFQLPCLIDGLVKKERRKEVSIWVSQRTMCQLFINENLLNEYGVFFSTHLFIFKNCYHIIYNYTRWMTLYNSPIKRFLLGI